MMGYGYENAAGDRISALIDMINGGGPGRSGGTFEGGGILSLLANAVAKPYGSVRERPGHTPMGAAAAPMDVLRPVPTGVGVEPVGTTALPAGRDPWLETPAVEERPAATGGRRFMEEDLAVLGSLHPDVAALFSGMRPGDPLSPQQAMFLDAARVGSATPTAGITIPPYTLALQDQPVPAPAEPLPVTSVDIAPATAYESLGEPTLFTQDQLDAMSPAMKLMAEEHNRENARLVAEDDILKITSAIEEAEARNVPIRVIIRGKAYTALPSGRAVAEE